MKTYTHERSVAGLEEKLQNNSITYSSPLYQNRQEVTSASFSESVAKTIAKLQLTFASEQDHDLYITKSILVTTNWNLNDDIFHPIEAWRARSTPSHKPTNIEHDEHEIVGHMTNTWAIADNGDIIPMNTPVEDLPELYHIVNGAVIYKSWQDEKLIARTDKLIEQIEANEKFVSMECFFDNFDYALIDNDSYKIVARNEDTSFLTSHLRAYGGDGVYNNQKVGRLLRNITFCGKGYVDKPANPKSIIFNSPDFSFSFCKATLTDKIEQNNECLKNGVSLSTRKEKPKREKSMSELLEKANEKLEAKISELETKLSEANELIASANTEQLKAEVEKLSKEAQAAKEAIEAKDAELVAKNSEIEELSKAKEALEASKAQLDEELTKVRASELEANRVSMLVDGGVEKEVATTKVQLFAGLSNEQFEAVAKEIIEAAKKKMDKKDEKKEDMKDDKGNPFAKSGEELDDDEDKSGEAAVKDVKVEDNQDIDLSLASKEDEEDNATTKARKEIASLLSKKKGE